ncbi:hypothetical protein [Xanthomonas hortorum]|uniref:hypothetical protein n=1 Tax=Xanthomonas hortorum TaxID=56454 RepID=UPI002FE393CB
MYYLFGDEVVTSLLLRRAGALHAQRLDDTTAVAGFNQFLQAHSIIEAAIDWVGPRLVDFEGLKPYAPLFAEQKKRFFAENSSLLRERLANGYFDRALQTLSDKAPRLRQMADFCVRLIVVNQLSEYTNGTTEDTIGVANFNFKDDFDELDFHELLVHQLVHMLLFVDDTLDPHMAQDRKDVQVETGLPFVMGGTCFPIYLAFQKKKGHRAAGGVSGIPSLDGAGDPHHPCLGPSHAYELRDVRRARTRHSGPGVRPGRGGGGTCSSGGSLCARIAARCPPLICWGWPCATIASSSRSA